MEYAGYGSALGDSLTASEFEKRAGTDYKLKGILPFCFACKEVVYTKGTLSPNIEAHYAHFQYDEQLDPMDYCIESSQGRRSKRLKGLHTDGWDLTRGPMLREDFFDEDNIKRAYVFCLTHCGKGNLPFSKFEQLISRADKKNIWAYRNIPVWVVPYILLLLTDFSIGGRFDIRFVLKKPTSLPLQNLWTENRYSISKIYADSQREVKNCITSIDIGTYSEIAQSVEWLRDDFVSRLISLKSV